MEKPVKKMRKEEPRHVMQPLLQERRSATSDKDIRRQLGWGLVEFAHKGLLR